MQTHPFAKNTRNKREMKKSRVPSAQECQESPEECVRAGGPSAPRGLRGPPAHLEPKAGSSTSSCGTTAAAPGQPRPAPLGGKTPAPDSPRDYEGGLRTYRSQLSPRPLSSPAPGRPRSARQRSPEKRPGEGLPRHGRRSASSPRRHPPVVRGEPP